MLVDQGVIKVGTEIEIVKWDNDRTYQKVCEDLIDAEYMVGPKAQWKKHHKYHCKCEKGGCGQVRSGKLIVPPLVSMTYDGSLPKTGAEFIISPILLAENTFRAQLEDIWSIICEDAVWSLDEADYYENDGSASPSIHLHVSVTSKTPSMVNQSLMAENDILHALSLFTPELFLLADVTGKRRGLNFRLPSRYHIENDPHHGFIQVRLVSNNMVYIEWRLIEAAYEDWDYVEGFAYLAAALTRCFKDPAGMSWFMSTGYEHPYLHDDMEVAVNTNDTEKLLRLVNVSRFNMLRDLCISSLDDDEYGANIVNGLFDRAIKHRGV